MKFSKLQISYLANVLVSVIMTIVMTGGMLLIHSGYSANFFLLWFKDFVVACLIAIPTGLLVAPAISKWSEKFINE